MDSPEKQEPEDRAFPFLEETLQPIWELDFGRKDRLPIENKELMHLILKSLEDGLSEEEHAEFLETLDLIELQKHEATIRTEEDRTTKKLTPEKLCRLWAFILPKYCRVRYLEPALEEVKEDRILAKVEAESDVQRRLIEGQFYVKLAVTYLFTLLCLLRDGLAKLSPVLKWFFTGTLR